MLEVTIGDFKTRIPRHLDDVEHARAEVLLRDAVEEVEGAIREHGADPSEWLVGANARRAQRVVRAMVAYAILVGEDIGKAAWSAATGPYNESVTYNANVGAVSLWGEVELTAQMRAYLQLSSSPVLFSAPAHDRWPERRRAWNQ